MTAFARGGRRREEGDHRLAGEIRLSGTRFNELKGPRRDLAGHLSIGHGVDTTPLAEILCRWSRGQVGLSRGYRAGVRALVSKRLEKKDQKGMAETEG